MTTAKKMSARRVRTGEVRLSYANLFTPRKADENADPKYSVSLIIPKTDTETIDLIKQAMNAALQEGLGKFGGKKPGNLRLALRDGDTDREDDPNYAGCYFVNCNSKNAPQVMHRVGGQLMPADDSDVYSGCYASVTVEFYAYNFNGNKGIGAGLGNVLKLRDGEPLSGGASAEDEFSDLGESAAAEFSDNQTASTGGFGNSDSLLD